MKQHELRSPQGAKKNRKRIGRGNARGTGTYSGRGIKGQNSRSGGGVRPGFEGGQQRLIKGMPSLRGFTNIFRTEYAPVNIDILTGFETGTEVTLGLMVSSGIVKDLSKPVKVLGRGEITIPLTVEANSFSESAKRKIEAAGGSVREV
ncbi:MAG: 50S ribosomal protein L15 [SAR202 cluster bacterium]|nr:50S ribosomal protein L15 [SAR202 cluster bacterium]